MHKNVRVRHERHVVFGARLVEKRRRPVAKRRVVDNENAAHWAARIARRLHAEAKALERAQRVLEFGERALGAGEPIVETRRAAARIVARRAAHIVRRTAWRCRTRVAHTVLRAMVRRRIVPARAVLVDRVRGRVGQGVVDPAVRRIANSNNMRIEIFSSTAIH